MATISLCMIVKNEEAVLERCLLSIQDAVDEIIIVDTGSTDRTKEIAKSFTPRVYDFKWNNDFSSARNYSFSMATMDYQMWLDADDVLEDSEKKKLIDLKAALPEHVDVVTMRYNTHFDASGNPILTSTRGRLFRRSGNFRWHDPVHEYVPMIGNVINTDITISHRKEKTTRSDRNLKIYEQQLANGVRFTPRSLYYYARELRDHGRYSDAARYFRKFLNSEAGWVEDNIAACLALAQCYKELERKSDRTEALLRSFTYDLPRPEICCELAYDYMKNKDYSRAAYWFNQALNSPVKQHAGFVLNDYRGFIPHIELCVCYYQMGNMDMARHHNEEAAKIKPDVPSVQYNRSFFSSLN